MCPDAIIVLAGGIKQDASGRWVSTNLSIEDDAFGAPGGKLRVLAGAVLATEHPDALVIASGGKGYDVSEDAPEDRSTLAEILRDELADAGVSRERIVLEQHSNTTYQQLQELEALLGERGLMRVLFITNRYHLSRLRTLLEMKFPALMASAELVSAEDVLIERDAARWEALVNEAYESAALKERIAREEQGVAQIRAGTYQFR